MIDQTLATLFLTAGRALMSGVKDTGFTSNGLKKLDFRVGDKIYTALEANPNKLSLPAKLSREGHKIVLIRDSQELGLTGFVDVDEKTFNSFEQIPNPVDIEEIMDALGDELPRREEVKITAARTATPVNISDLPGGKRAA